MAQTRAHTATHTARLHEAKKLAGELHGHCHHSLRTNYYAEACKDYVVDDDIITAYDRNKQGNAAVDASKSRYQKDRQRAKSQPYQPRGPTTHGYGLRPAHAATNQETKATQGPDHSAIHHDGNTGCPNQQEHLQKYRSTLRNRIRPFSFPSGKKRQTSLPAKEPQQTLATTSELSQQNQDPKLGPVLQPLRISSSATSPPELLGPKPRRTLPSPKSP